MPPQTPMLTLSSLRHGRHLGQSMTVKPDVTQRGKLVTRSHTILYRYDLYLPKYT